MWASHGYQKYCLLPDRLSHDDLLHLMGARAMFSYFRPWKKVLDWPYWKLWCWEFRFCLYKKCHTSGNSERAFAITAKREFIDDQ